MRAALRPLQVAAASMMVVAAGCASTEPEIHSVLVIDALTAGASDAPVDLEQSATSLGCATEPIFPVGAITLTVDDVVSARELVITGKYGRERIRPWLEPGTIVRLDELRTREDEITGSLRRALVGRGMLEPASSLVPAVTADGLRIVLLRTNDVEGLDSVVGSILDRWSAEVGRKPIGDVDLAVVSRDAESLQEHVRIAVAEAERWSDFSAPPGLVVEWGDLDDARDALASVLESGSCMHHSDARAAELEITVLAGPWGLSLPGGRVLIQEDGDWRELYLHFVLLHELVHQHQYALCSSGVELKSVPSLLHELHASSLAIEILERQGFSEAALDFVRESDVINGGATRAFDELRAGLDLDADGYLTYLASDPKLAERLADELDGPKVFANPITLEARAIPNDSLSFEFTPAEGVVTITNESDSPFSGTSDGWWYSKPASADGRQRRAGGAPFALCLPPRGRVTLTTQGIAPDADPASCFTVFRRTPAPMFDS